MQVHVADCEFQINGSPNHFVCGAWSRKPTREQVEDYIRETYKGCVKDPDTGELWPGEIALLQYTVRTTPRMTMLKGRRS